MDKDRIILFFVLFYSFGQIIHGQHIDGFDLTIYQVKINNTPIKKCLSETVPIIKKKYPIDWNRNLICVTFDEKGKTFNIRIKNKVVGFTDWYLYLKNYEVSGYLVLDNVKVIILGKGSIQYIKKKKKKQVMHIENYPPSNSVDWPYWIFGFNENNTKCVLLEKNEPVIEGPFE